jgi:tRNA U34 5-carboxymethylaminomethyl modifying GTPase MnmE/TrmE
MPEIVSIELRQAWGGLEAVGRGPLVEEVLDKIFARFCIGK